MSLTMQCQCQCVDSYSASKNRPS